jgi:hypothetical protein
MFQKTVFSKYTLVADIAGRVSLDISGSSRVTAAAFAIETSRFEKLRIDVANKKYPKWKNCTIEDAEAVIDFLVNESLSVSVLSVDKDTDAWRLFWESAKPLQAKMLKESNKQAGFAKPANLTMYWLFCDVFANATAQAFKCENGEINLSDKNNDFVIENTIICDSDIKGEENIDVFNSIWVKHNSMEQKSNQFGIKIGTKKVDILTEEEEPLLILSDYIAGLAHSSLITNEGRIALPLDCNSSKKLLNKLVISGKLIINNVKFDLVYDDIFEVLSNV